MIFDGAKQVAFPAFSNSQKMYYLKDIPSTTSVLSTYTAFTASAMLVRSVISEVQAISGQLIPNQLKDLLLSKLGGLFSSPSSQMILLINEYDGCFINELYEASVAYLQTKITTSMARLNVSKAPRDSKVTVTIHRGEKVVDIYEGIQLKWEMTYVEKKGLNQQGKLEDRVLELSFHNKCMEMVINSYLPHVIQRSKAIREENKVVKLVSLGNLCGDETNLDHPATFDKLAMDPTVKKELIDDLDRFVRRREYYKRVGKAWKRGYLLYGPPGTGKSSLIAAMANYLQFDVYDLELTSIYSNSDLQRLLVSTRNRSMVVIEDIDCSIELQNRQEQRFESGEFEQGTTNNNNKLTLSGLLNFIDGLWSSCGDERIIVFTTNHKDRLDPALLRPGRMDMHIHMSYCTPSGFRVLASNYLCITEHNLFDEIDELMMQVEVTPAQVAEEIMKSEDSDVALQGLVKFLRDKKSRSENGDSDRQKRI